MSGHVFPRCELHSTLIETDFPAGCPLADAHPLAYLRRYQDRAVWQPGTDPHAATTFGRIFDTCHACVTRLMPDEHVRRLRKRKGFDA